MHPETDEVPRIARLPGLFSQCILPNRQRTGLIEPRQYDDEQYRSQVSRPQPEISCPLPLQKPTSECERQPRHHEANKERVQRHHEISQNSVDNHLWFQPEIRTRYCRPLRRGVLLTAKPCA